MTRLLRLLPLYASGILLAIAVALVADSRDWSPLKAAVAGFVVAVIYLAAVAVPWLLRELGDSTRRGRGVLELIVTDIAISPSNGHHVPSSVTTEGGSKTKMTHVTVTVG